MGVDYFPQDFRTHVTAEHLRKPQAMFGNQTKTLRQRLTITFSSYKHHTVHQEHSAVNIICKENRNKCLEEHPCCSEWLRAEDCVVWCLLLSVCVLRAISRVQPCWAETPWETSSCFRKHPQRVCVKQESEEIIRNRACLCWVWVYSKSDKNLLKCKTVS